MWLQFELGGFHFSWKVFHYDIMTDTKIVYCWIVTRKYMKHYGVCLLASNSYCPMNLTWFIHTGNGKRPVEYKLALPVQRVN